MALIPSNKRPLQKYIQEKRTLFLPRSYAYSKSLGLDDRIFKINCKRAWQIIKEAGKRTRLQKEA